LADHDRHLARAVDPDAGRRGNLRRGRVQLPGHGAGVLPGGTDRGRRDVDGVHGERDGGDGRREPAGGCWLCDARPEGEVLMSLLTPPPEPPSVGAPPEGAPDGAGTLTAVEAADLGLAPAVKPRSMLRRGWEVFAENKLALVSLGVLVLMVAFCFIGPLIYQTDQVHTNLTDYLCKPSAGHLLGCNDLGYDQLGRLMVGGQTSLEVGFAAALVAVLIGTLYGAF